MTHIVTFCGPDGSGKSTQADLLTKYMNENLDVRVVQPIYLLVDLLGIQDNIGDGTSPRHQATHSKTPWHKRIATYLLTYPYLLLTTLYLQVQTEDIIVCDRYIYQTLYDVYGNNAEYMLRLLPTPDQGFLLNPSIDILLERMDDEDSSVDTTYYENVRAFYTKSADQLNLIELSAEQNAEDIHRQVRIHMNEEQI